jgi:replicative DNA helicase
MKAMKEGGDPFLIADSLKLNLATVRTREEEAPPPFSVARLEKESRGLLSGLSTGWQALDEVDVRLHGGELAILAARTGHGKTTALVNLLDNLTEEAEDDVVLFFSLEEPEVRVFHRLLALRTAKQGRPWTVNLVRDRLLGLDGEFEDEDALDEALAHLKAKENALRIIYRPAWTPERIGAYVADVARERKVRAVLVDYLQRVRPGLEGRRRDEEVSHIARTLRAVAVDTGAPLVVGAQINREAAKRGDLDGAQWGTKTAMDALRKKRPQLHELREGGSEQEAEIVLGLHNWRADYQEDMDERTLPPGATRLEVGVLKNRYGTVGKWAPLAFEAENGLIRDPRDGREV